LWTRIEIHNLGETFHNFKTELFMTTTSFRVTSLLGDSSNYQKGVVILLVPNSEYYSKNLIMKSFFLPVQHSVHWYSENINIKKTFFELRYLINTQQNEFLEDDIIKFKSTIFLFQKLYFLCEIKQLIIVQIFKLPSTRPKTWTVFACSNTGIVGSNSTQGMDVCVRVFPVCAGYGLATGWSPVQGVLPTVYKD
jgi:hypothetical protein